jgi:hypothetical protein
MTHRVVRAALPAMALLVSGIAFAEAAPPTCPNVPSGQIVDSKCTIVGTLLFQNTVARTINGTVYMISGVVRPGLLADAVSQISLYFTSSNCTGTTYLDATQLPSVAYMTVPNGEGTLATTVTINYPGAPQLVSVGSTSFGGVCTPQSFSLDLGAVQTTTLTVVPPLVITP